MSADRAGLLAHLAGGVTTLCRCWRILRRDGVALGFTDHDAPLAFGGLSFRPETGMSAGALAGATGLSVDNTEALGALSDSAIRESDIETGRYDGAEVTAWLVNWTAPAQRIVLFAGEIGEMTWAQGAFTAELRGLSAALNRPTGRAYQRACAACPGDAACRADLTRPGLTVEAALLAEAAGTVLRVGADPGLPADWFARGRAEVLEGPAAGLHLSLRSDTPAAPGREIVLWQGLRHPIAAGTRLRLIAGCDGAAGTCRTKFDNFLNFGGFPHIPGDDWLTSYPRRGQAHTGASLFGGGS